MGDKTLNPASANEYIEQQLHLRLGEIEQRFDAHSLCFMGPITSGTDDVIRVAIENRRAKEEKKARLVVLLTTEGGYVEIVQRIVETFRHFYEIVDFVIPNYAYSAGTVMVMSGNDIYMDYYSRLGPTDPQMVKDGRWIPALGYVEKFNGLLMKAQDGSITQAELQLMISGFDQALIYQFEHAKELSIALVKEWLPMYKFKNWHETEIKKEPVTDERKAKIAEQIATALCDSGKWHTHGRGISKRILYEQLGLKTNDFGADEKLGTMIRDYHNLVTDYTNKLGIIGVVHTVDSYRMMAM